MAEEIVPTLAQPARHRPRALLRDAAGALPQSGAAAPHAADRDGRLAEAAAAAARHGARPPRRAAASIRHLTLAVAGWMRYASGVDEHGARDRGVRSAGRRATPRSRRTRRAMPPGSRAASSASRRSSATTCRATPAFADAVAHHLASLLRARRRRDARRPPRAIRPTGRSPCIAARAPSRPPVPRRPADARARAPAVRDGQGPADRQPARPHRSALVRRRRAVRERERAVHHAGPLRVPDALQPGRARSRTSASRGATAGRSRRDARKIWRTFAAHYHLFRGTPTRHVARPRVPRQSSASASG